MRWVDARRGARAWRATRTEYVSPTDSAVPGLSRVGKPRAAIISSSLSSGVANEVDELVAPVWAE
eukprot:6845182-Prymnesium_polylepis.2